MARQLRVVFLGGDASTAKVARRSLEVEHGALDWHEVSDAAGFRAALEGAVPDVILADYALPGLDGLAALDIARTVRPITPFIFVADTVGGEIAIESLKRGATDWVLKSHNRRLAPVVARALREADERTGRERAQRAPDAQRLLLECVIDTIPDLLYAVDRGGRIILGNAAFLKNRQLAAIGQALGRTLTDLMPERGMGVRLDEENARVMREGRGYHEREQIFYGAGGSALWYSVTKAPLRSPSDGTIIGLVTLVCDVTERKELERSVLEVSEREQRRIGGDLHDGLGQELTGVSLLLKSLDSALARDCPQHIDHLRQTYQVLQTAISSTRSIARVLAPVDLEQAGLPAALGALLNRSQEVFDVECHLDCSGNPDFPLDLTRATHLYRIAQEAVSNATRHGHARHVDVRLHMGEGIVLKVTNDGTGFDPIATGAAPGMGLRLMRYRASLLGGTVTVTSDIAGTHVECHCPAVAQFAQTVAP
jgi:PAS domain S-box-containing protein